MAKDPFWTPEKITQLTQLWAVGRTCSQIAAVIPGSTRNSIIGKVRRIGLANRAPSGPRRAKGSRKPRQQTLVAILRPTQEPVPLEEPPPIRLQGSTDGLVRLVDLTKMVCRWPVGDPRAKDFHFCGHKPKEGAIYCPYHCSVAYQGKIQSLPKQRA